MQESGDIAHCLWEESLSKEAQRSPWDFSQAGVSMLIPLCCSALSVEQAPGPPPSQQGSQPQASTQGVGVPRDAPRPNNWELQKPARGPQVWARKENGPKFPSAELPALG